MNSMLTDRTISLREHKDVAKSVLTGKCRNILAKYNVTKKEYSCVCWVNCPWRSLTEEENMLNQAFIDLVLGRHIFVKYLSE